MILSRREFSPGVRQTPLLSVRSETSSPLCCQPFRSLSHVAASTFSMRGCVFPSHDGGSCEGSQWWVALDAVGWIEVGEGLKVVRTRDGCAASACRELFRRLAQVIDRQRLVIAQHAHLAKEKNEVEATQVRRPKNGGVQKEVEVQCSAVRTRWRLWRLALAAVVDPGVSSESKCRSGTAAMEACDCRWSPIHHR